MNHKADIDNPETASVSLRPWHEIVRDTLKAQRGPARHLRAGQCAQAADRGASTPTRIFTAFADGARGGGGRHRRRRLDGRHARHRADADQRLRHPRRTCWPRCRCAFQIPVLMMVSERGTLGEFNLGQAMVCRTMRPMLDSLGDRAPHDHPPRRARVHRRSLDQAGGRDAARRSRLILSPLLTGGKVFKPHELASVGTEHPPLGHGQRPGDEPLRPDQAAGRQARTAKKPSSAASATPISISGRPASGRRISTCSAAWGSPARSRSASRWRSRSGSVIALGGRRLAADAARLPRHHRDAQADEPDHRGDGQRHLPDHRRPADRDRGTAPTSSRSRAAPASPSAAGRPTRPISRTWSTRALAEDGPSADRRAHRRQAGRRRRPSATRSLIRDRFMRGLGVKRARLRLRSRLGSFAVVWLVPLVAPVICFAQTIMEQSHGSRIERRPPRRRP